MDEPIKVATHALRDVAKELASLATGSRDIRPTLGVFMHNAPPTDGSSPEDQEVHCDYPPGDYVGG